MNDYTRKLLDKAMDAIESAELLLEHGKTDVAGKAALCYNARNSEIPIFWRTP